MTNLFEKRSLTFSDRMSYLGKYFSWMTYALVAVVLIIFGAIHIIAGFFPDSAAAQYILPEIFRNALDEAEGADPGQRGDYFNFLIGVPLAAAGSAVAAVVAASAKSVANRQRIVQEMDLADKKLTHGSDDFRRLVNAFDDLYEHGIAFQQTISELRKIAREEGINILAILRHDRINDPNRITEGPRVDELREIYEDVIRSYLTMISQKCATVFEVYQILTFDPFWSRAIEHQASDISNNWFSLEALMREELGLPPLEPDERSPRAIARQIRRWAQDHDHETAVMSVYYLPEDASPIDLIGAVIKLTTADNDVPRLAALRQWDAGDETTLRILNRGAASLFTLYYAMPSEEALRDTVFSLFPHLNSYESRGYFASLPNKRRITHDELNDTIDETFEAPGSLVYLQGMSKTTIYEWPERLQSRASDQTGKRPTRRKTRVTDIFKRNRDFADNLANKTRLADNRDGERWDGLLSSDPDGAEHYERLQSRRGRRIS